LIPRGREKKDLKEKGRLTSSFEPQRQGGSGLSPPRTKRERVKKKTRIICPCLFKLRRRRRPPTVSIFLVSRPEEKSSPTESPSVLRGRKRGDRVFVPSETGGGERGRERY